MAKLRLNKIVITLGLLAAILIVAFFAKEFLEDSSVPTPQVEKDSQQEQEKIETATTSAGTSNSKNYQLQVQGATINEPDRPPVVAPPPQSDQVTLKINVGSDNYSYQVKWTESMSVYDVLEKASQENGFTLVAKWNQVLKSYYVTGIHDTVCECWKYELNGQEPPLGSSLVKVSKNDTVIWKKI